MTRKIGPERSVGRDLEGLFGGQAVAGLGDVQLLGRFVERRDEPAFAALVARHGPMVLGVCRRLLADPFDVEDAFQATFLVLARRAASLGDGGRLAPWLFGVARRVATRARADLARRRSREVGGVEQLASPPDRQERGRELGRALVEEIERLPGPLREPILLCCMEGLTYDEAASRLRSTAPAVRGRLARARGRLKDRLARRGFAPAVGASGAFLSAESVPAAVSPRLLSTTTAQVAKAGMVPAAVECLAEGVIRTMILTKWKLAASALVACGVVGSSIGLGAQDGLPGAGPAQNPPTEANRLDKVERKLDRVLQALEGNVPKVSAAPAPAPAPPPPPSPTGPQLPPAPARPSVRSPFDLDPVGDGSPAITARLDSLETKLGRLESRLANLERRLGPEAKTLSAPNVSNVSLPNRRQ